MKAIKLRSRDLFEGLDGEIEQPRDRNVEVAQSDELNYLIQAFKEYLPEARGAVTGQLHSVAKRIIDRSIPARTITEFGIVLPGYCTGEYSFLQSMFFFPAAINRSNDLSHVLNFESFPVPPDFAGYGLAEGKSLAVYGDCGAYAGDSNEGAQVFNGDCGVQAGYGNRGTQIFNGEVKSFGAEIEGTIYHRDKLIVENGRLVE